MGDNGRCTDMRAPWMHRAAIYVQALAVGAAVFGALQNLGDTQDTAKVHSVGSGSVSQLGEVVGLEYSLWQYCVTMQALSYGNHTTRICLAYDDKFTLVRNGSAGMQTLTDRDGCDQFESAELCQSRSLATVLLFAFICVGSVALVVPERSAVFLGLTVLCAALGMAVVGKTDSTIASLNADDAAASMEWGSGLVWCLCAALLAALATVLAAVPRLCSERSEAADLDLHVSVTRIAQNKPDPETTIKASAGSRLAEYRSFASSAVGIPGRTGTVCGLVMWMLLAATLMESDWVRVDEAPSASSPLGQLASVPKAIFGGLGYCLERPGTVSPTMTRDTFKACFGYGDALTLVDTALNTSTGASTTVIVQGDMCDLLGDANFCALKWQTSLALVLGIVVTWCGLGVPELTYVQASCTFVGATCGCAAAVLLAAMRNEANDKIGNIFDTGVALSMAAIAVCFGMGGVALGVLDYWLVGRYTLNSAPCVKQ
eukprot:m.197049 g.197049  ORF g.197049 m.197049 type:complete len:487 (+) comp25077_c0_seq6:737-2197(+)